MLCVIAHADPKVVRGGRHCVNAVPCHCVRSETWYPGEGSPDPACPAPMEHQPALPAASDGQLHGPAHQHRAESQSGTAGVRVVVVMIMMVDNNKSTGGTLQRLHCPLMIDGSL